MSKYEEYMREKAKEKFGFRIDNGEEYWYDINSKM